VPSRDVLDEGVGGPIRGPADPLTVNQRGRWFESNSGNVNACLLLNADEKIGVALSMTAPGLLN
jgi:hypothetical protein